METTDDSAICRLCLLGGDCLIYIFKEHAGQMCVPEVIRNFLRIQVLEDDGYPPYVCMSCFDKLTDIKQFRDQCMESRLTYDNLKATRQSCLRDSLERCSSPFKCLSPTEAQEPLTEVKKEEEDSIDDEEAEIPLDIVKTELEEDFEGSAEGTSLTHSGGGYEEDSQQQERGSSVQSAEERQAQRWAFSGLWNEEHGSCASEGQGEGEVGKAAPWRSISQDGAYRGCSKLPYVPGFTFKFAEEMGNRLWKDRVRQARRRAMETPEERQRRLAQDRERTRLRRANESPEEKARRLERARVYMAQKRRRLMTLVELEQGSALAYQARLMQEQGAADPH